MYTRNCPNCGNIINYKNEKTYKNGIKRNTKCIMCYNKHRKYKNNNENKNIDYIRNCPKCNKRLFYKNKYTYNKAIKNNSKCNKCNKLKSNEETNYFRNCPICNKKIYYLDQQKLNYANKKNNLCLSCSLKQSKLKDKNYIRHCPKCNNIIKYLNEYSKNKADKNKTLCVKCLRKITMNKPEIIEKFKKHSQGKNNPMYGKSFYDIWVEKYGKEIADEKYKKWKNNISKSTKGKNNPMYGKPAPTGSGNGWSGWYEGYYFRSLLELSYLKYLLDNNIKFESGEKRIYQIKYMVDNKERSYFPDFYLIDTQEIIEIKPYKFINLKINKLKFEAGKKLYGNKFKIITENDINKLKFNDIYNLYINKKIIFLKRYEDKFKNIIESNNIPKYFI